jgi:hypothetical protein
MDGWGAAEDRQELFYGNWKEVCCHDCRERWSHWHTSSRGKGLSQVLRRTRHARGGSHREVVSGAADQTSRNIPMPDGLNDERPQPTMTLDPDISLAATHFQNIFAQVVGQD